VRIRAPAPQLIRGVIRAQGRSSGVDVMVALLLMPIASLVSPAQYTGPSPTLPFWRTLVAQAGEQALSQQRAVRLIRVPEGLISATIVTVEATPQGGRVTVREIPDRRKPGATSRSRAVSTEEYERVASLARAGLWSQASVAPTGRPELHDGVLWYIEGVRHGDRHSIVRHEPTETSVLTLCSEMMELAGLADQSPR
jgi:hypothetical protein